MGAKTTQKHTRGVPDFGVVMERVKDALKLTSAADVAAALGLKRNAFYNRRAAGSIPYQELVALAGRHDLRVDWVLFGIGQPFRDTGDSAAELPARASVDSELFGEIVFELERAFQEIAPHSAGAKALGGLAAMVYNKFQFTTTGKVRRAMIRHEALELARVARVMEQSGPADAQRGKRGKRE